MNRFVLFLPLLLSLSCDTAPDRFENQRNMLEAGEGNVEWVTVASEVRVLPTKEMSCVEYLYSATHPYTDDKYNGHASTSLVQAQLRLFACSVGNVTCYFDVPKPTHSIVPIRGNDSMEGADLVNCL